MHGRCDIIPLWIHACPYSTNTRFVCQSLRWAPRYHSEQPDMTLRLLLGPVVQQMVARVIFKERRFWATHVRSEKVQRRRTGDKPSKCLFVGQNQYIFSKVWWNTLSPRQLSATNCNQSITFIRLQAPGTWVGDAEEVIGAAMGQGLSWTKPMKSAPLSRSLQGTSLSSECHKDGWHLKADFHFIFLKSLKDGTWKARDT